MTPAELRKRLRELINEHLALPDRNYSNDTAFADIGLSSENCCEVSGKLEVVLDRRVDPMDMWNYPTINELTTRLVGD